MLHFLEFDVCTCLDSDASVESSSACGLDKLPEIQQA